MNKQITMMRKGQTVIKITIFCFALLMAFLSHGQTNLDSTFVANEKLNCVYNKLKADNSSLFSETVGAFIDNPSANLIFTVGNCTTTNDACTDDNYFAETGIIKITIEDVNTNPIEIEALILHEAYMLSYVSMFMIIKQG